MKLRLIFIFLFLTSCGYTGLYKDYDKKQILVKEKIFRGESSLDNRIYNKLNIQESTDPSAYTIEINSNRKTELLSKNKSGEAKIYKMTISSQIIVKQEGTTLINKKIFKNITYNNIENKFELLKYERDLENNLVNQIADNIGIEFLSI
jgi:hypothetical protein